MRSFRTIWRVFEYLLHAIVGQFEPDVRYSVLSRGVFSISKFFPSLGVPPVKKQFSFSVDQRLFFGVLAPGRHCAVESADLCSGEYL